MKGVAELLGVVAAHSCYTASPGLLVKCESQGVTPVAAALDIDVLVTSDFAELVWLQA